MEAEDFRADEADDMDEERARQRRKAGREQEGRELVARDIDAETLQRDALAVLDRWRVAVPDPVTAALQGRSAMPVSPTWS